MLSSLLKGFALVVFWLACACIYQSYIRHDDCLVGSVASKDRKKSILASQKKIQLDLDNLEITEAKDLELQLNELSIEVINLKMRQGIPNGYK